MPFEPSAVVYTWGTQHGASAYGHGAKAVTQGGNPGHASIAVRFPANVRGKELIEKYCGPNRIPYSLKKLPFTGEEYYEVYFSYWPGIPKHLLSKTLEDDQEKERLGVHFDWREELLSDSDIEIDRRGKKTLAPAMILHATSGNPEVNKLLEEYALYYNQFRKIENDLWKVNQAIKKSKEKTSKFDPKKLNLRKEKLEEMMANMKDKLAKTKKDLADRQVPLDKYITRGTPPNNTVSLPVVDTGQDLGTRQGLDLEGILQGMVKAANHQEGYSLYGNNCSAAVATAIYGGIPKHKKTLKKKFKAKGFLGVATPQTVYNATAKGQHYLYVTHTKKPSNVLEDFLELLKEIVKAFQQKPKNKK